MNDNRFFIDILQKTRQLLSFHDSMGVRSYPATDGTKSFLAADAKPAKKIDSPAGPSQTSKTVYKTAKKAAEKNLASNDATLEEISIDLGNCERCSLCSKRSKIVFGSGAAEADLFIIGEWPDSDEDREGKPFKGAVGELLDRMLKAINMTREQVYLANIVKCHPGPGAVPNEDDIAACRPFLIRQIAIVNPKVILTMGPTAAQTMLKSKDPLSRLRGRFHTFRGIALMPTYHPDYLISNQDMKKATWVDLQMVQKRCASGK